MVRPSLLPISQLHAVSNIFQTDDERTIHQPWHGQPLRDHPMNGSVDAGMGEAMDVTGGLRVEGMDTTSLSDLEELFGGETKREKEKRKEKEKGKGKEVGGMSNQETPSAMIPLFPDAMFPGTTQRGQKRKQLKDIMMEEETTQTTMPPLSESMFSGTNQRSKKRTLPEDIMIEEETPPVAMPLFPDSVFPSTTTPSSKRRALEDIMPPPKRPARGLGKGNGTAVMREEDKENRAPSGENTYPSPHL